MECTDYPPSPRWFHLSESQTDPTPLTAPRHTDPSLSYVIVYMQWEGNARHAVWGSALSAGATPFRACPPTVPSSSWARSSKMSKLQHSQDIDCVRVARHRGTKQGTYRE